MGVRAALFSFPGVGGPHKKDAAVQLAQQYRISAVIFSDLQ
jgi:hypothetical protein